MTYLLRLSIADMTSTVVLKYNMSIMVKEGMWNIDATLLRNIKDSYIDNIEQTRLWMAIAFARVVMKIEVRFTEKAHS
ncbi:MAG: hypothetical protein RJQ14_19825 [Marinoscillum sp.]